MLGAFNLKNNFYKIKNLKLRFVLAGAFIFVLILVLVFVISSLNSAKADWFGGSSGSAAWYSTGGTWNYRKTITIDHTKVPDTDSSGGETNFPVLIDITDSNLAANAQPNGNDIFFTSSDGTTKLAHEIEKYDSTTGHLIAWVKIPSLSSTANTVIYMYYGLSGATTATDNFNRADADPAGSNWTTVPGSPYNMKISGDTMQPHALDDDAAAYYNAITWPADQYSQVKINATCSSCTGSLGPMVRASSANYTMYMAIARPGTTNNVVLQKYVSGSFTPIWMRSTTVNNGDTVRLEVQGTTLRVYINGVQVGTDTTDTDISSGNAGLFYSSTMGAASFDDWAGGNLVTDMQTVSPTKTDVWDTNYKLVWHLGDVPTTAKDSTTNGHDATTITATAASGKIGGAASFSSTLIDNNTNTTDFQFVTANSFTEEAWIYPTANCTAEFNCGVLGYVASDGSIIYHQIQIRNDNNHWFYAINDNNNNLDGGAISLNTWQHVVGVHTPSGTFIYVNGSLVNSNIYATLSPESGVFTLGTDHYSDNFTGRIDEGRVSNIARSADWIKTEYNNQSATSTFYTLEGSQESNSTWSYRKTITIDHTKVPDTDSSGGETNFPVLIDITDSNLAANAQPNGNDIFFTSSDGTTKLAHEIEKYDSTTGHLIAWVKIPSLSSTANTVIYMYYGLSGATTATDNFNRADADPAGSNWTTVPGSPYNMKISGDTMQPHALDDDAAAYYNAITWPADQYSQVKINATCSSCTGSLGPMVRASSANYTMYMAIARPGTTNNVVLQKYVSGSFTPIWMRSTTVNNGDTVRLEVQGTTLRVYINGVQVGTDTTDTDISSGNAGLFYSSIMGAASFDDWAGGNLVTDMQTVSPTKTDVWSNGYAGVYHLGESSNPYNDSSTNSNNSNSGVYPTATAGKIGGAQVFSGSQYIGLTSDPIATNTVTVCSWVYLTSPSVAFLPVVGNGQFFFGTTNRNSTPVTFIVTSDANDSVESGYDVNLNQWAYVCAVRPSGGAGTGIYVNGNLSGTLGSSGGPVAGSGLDIGYSADSGQNWPGSIDELSISSTVRSADWIKTEYNNQSATSTFYTLESSPETPGGGGASAISSVKIRGGGGGGTATINQIEVVGATTDGSHNTATVTLGSPTSKGELVVVSVFGAYAGGASDGPVVTDSQSNTYAKVWSALRFNDHISQAWYLENAPSGITSVTVNNLTSNNGGLIVAHYTGVATFGALDQYVPDDSANQGTPWASTAVTTTNANDLLVGTINSYLATYNGGNQDAIASTGNWTKDLNINGGTGYLDGTNGSQFAYTHQIVSSIQTNIQNTGTNNGSTNVYDNHPGILSFKAATISQAASSINIRGGGGGSSGVKFR